MKTIRSINICKLGNFYLPDLERKLKYIFYNVCDIHLLLNSIDIGEPDYVIGDFIKEYSIENLSAKIRNNFEYNDSTLVTALINQPIEKNYFSIVNQAQNISILSLHDIEVFDIELEKYLILGIVEHFIVHSKNHDWHIEERRCIFDFCGDKKNISKSSKYLALCDECKINVGADSEELIKRANFAISNSYLNLNKSMISVFFSYSHKDETTKDKIDISLSALKRSEKIKTWNDRKITPGTEWDDNIKKELENADLILLLISADFLASDYIWNVEIKKAIEKHERKETIVIPIFCRSCDYKEMPFAKIQGLPPDAQPLLSFTDLDEGLTLIAKGIRKVVEELIQN
jgi:hypothetical protein